MSTWETIATKRPKTATPDVFESLVAAWNRRGPEFSGSRKEFCFAFSAGFVALTDSMELRAALNAARSRFLGEGKGEHENK